MLISNFDPASAKTVQEWITAVGAMPTIEPDSPRENGYIDSLQCATNCQTARSFYARPRFSSRAARAELRNSHRSSAHYSHWPDNGIRCVSARLPRWRLYLFVVQSGHQDFRDAMPIYISRGRFRWPVCVRNLISGRH